MPTPPANTELLMWIIGVSWTIITACVIAFVSMIVHANSKNDEEHSRLEELLDEFKETLMEHQTSDLNRSTDFNKSLQEMRTKLDVLRERCVANHRNS